MLQKLLIVFLFSFIACNCLLAQQPSRDELQKKQQQLFKEINDLNNELSSIKGNKKAALRAYTVVQNKIKARESLVNNISREIKNLDESIFLNEREIYRLKKELDTLKVNYAKSLVFAYKNRGSNDYLNFLFSAQNFNDAMKRIAYLKSYRQYRETQAETINKTQDLLQQTKTKLTNNLNEKSAALTSQTTQLQVLQEDKKDKDQVVKQLKDQEKDLTAQISQRQKENQKLKRAIDAAIKREIDEARKREADRMAKAKAAAADAKRLEKEREKEANAKVPGTTPSKPNTPVEDVSSRGVAKNKGGDKPVTEFNTEKEGVIESLNFERNKGRLPWPIDGGRVKGEFGRHLIEGTKLEEDNEGMFFATQIGASVKAVAEGEVSAVFDLGDVQAVLVKHGKYYTTYANLESVNVKRGDEVKAGSLLGKVAANMSGEGEFQFQVTNERRQYLNPRGWLRSR